jgi:hypothetical protein
MSQTRRVLLGILIIGVIAALVIGVDALRRRSAVTQAPAAVTLAPGSIPIYLNGELETGFVPGDMEKLPKVSFLDSEEGKTQEGWLLRDVLLQALPQEQLEPETVVRVSASSSGKSTQLTWAEITDEQNMVMFDVAGRGTLKLVSLLEKLDTRDEWVQDVDRIEVDEP